MAQPGRTVVVQVTRLLQNSPENVKVTLPDPNDMTKLDVEFVGPADTPYAGGHFHFLMTLADGFPHKAPSVAFSTKIYHPNVEKATGEACIEILLDNCWKPTVKLTKVIQEVIDLLKNPNPAHAREEEIAAQFANDHDAFVRTAQQWTQQYAT